MDIFKKLEQIVSDYKGEKITLKPETTFDDLEFDSLDKVELLMKIEQEFNFQFSDDIQIGAVGELEEIIRKNIK